MIDTTTVDGPTNRAMAGTTSPATCGLTAMTMTAGSGIACGPGLSLSPRAASPVIAGVGCGSITATRAGASPSPIQPSSIAEPILPAPTSTMSPRKPPSADGPPASDVDIAVAPETGAALFARAPARPHDHGMRDLSSFGGLSDHGPRSEEAYASPKVSNMAASIASAAGLPAQMTNWSAWK